MESTGMTRTVSKIDTSCLVHISVATPYSQATSKYFIQDGIHGGLQFLLGRFRLLPLLAASPLQWYAESRCINSSISVFCTTHHLTSRDGIVFKSVLRAPGKVKDIFSNPEIIVSFGRDSLEEWFQAIMSGLGLRKEAIGRRAHYQIHHLTTFALL